MTIFVSHRPNHDPEPYVGADGRRYSHPSQFAVGTLDPRPEFDQTRDPEPYRENFGSRFRHSHPASYGETKCEWAPRHDEFDPPVNPILANLRWAVDNWGDESEDGNGPFELRYERWLHYVEEEFLGFDYTPEQLDHARKVLTRLVALTNDDNGWRIQK